MNDRIPASPGVARFTFVLAETGDSTLKYQFRGGAGADAARFTFVLATKRLGQSTKGQETSGAGDTNEDVLELRWKCEALAMLALLGFGAAALFAFLWLGKIFLW